MIRFDDPVSMITSYLDWAILAVLVFAYGLVAGRLKQTPLSGAVVFLLTGLILGPAGLGWLGINVTSENLRTIAELTLALILFTDAASANLPVLRDSRRLPIRLLALGLPLTILMGMGVAQICCLSSVRLRRRSCRLCSPPPMPPSVNRW